MKILHKLYYYFLIYPIYKLRFGAIGKKSWLRNAQIEGFSNIFIGNNVYISCNGWVAAIGSKVTKLYIGSGTYIGRNAHIYATKSIAIGVKVLIADKVYISDNLHEYKNIYLPVIDQPIKQLKPVVIGDGAWLGENACIIGASVGKNSVIGANAVVTKDIPDYCVAVGCPAIIIKRFNFELNSWQKTDKAGNFI